MVSCLFPLLKSFSLSLSHAACLITLNVLSNLNPEASLSSFTDYAAKKEQTDLAPVEKWGNYCRSLEKAALSLFDDLGTSKITPRSIHKRGAKLLQALCILIVNAIDNKCLPSDESTQLHFRAILAFSLASGAVSCAKFSDQLYASLYALFEEKTESSIDFSENCKSGSGIRMSLNKDQSGATAKIYILAKILGRYALFCIHPTY